MQGPGDWLQLGFVLNWKCLVPGVKAKPCIGHWDSCAQEETRMSPGIWTCSPGEQGTAGSQDASSLGWPEGRDRNKLCSASRCKPTSKLGILNSFTENIKKAPLLLVKVLSQLSSPVPAFSDPWFIARVMVFMGQKQKCKEEHENQDSVRGTIWEWEDLDHSPGSHALLFWLKETLEIDVNGTCLEFSAAWSHCSGHSTDSEVFLYPGADSNLSHRFLRLKWNKIVFNFVGQTWDSLGLIFQRCDKATALGRFLQGSAGIPLCAASTSCIFEIRKKEKWDVQA